MRFLSKRATVIVGAAAGAGAMVLTALAVSASASRNDDVKRTTSTSVVVGSEPSETATSPTSDPTATSGPRATPRSDDAYEHGTFGSGNEVNEHENGDDRHDDDRHDRDEEARS
jgi:hypothetical protein